MTLARYRITATLGAGGMGEVYRATDTALGREVALKVLPAEVASDAERLARFEREAKLLASLSHPNVAHVYGFESATLETGATLHFLAMELAEGEDLSERLKRGPVPVDEALGIAKQIAEALEEAHEHGIVHRDLKPANVKVTPDGKVKVLDFGLAKAWAGDAAASSSAAALSQSPTLAHTGTQAGVILGTAAYMSPEQARGKPVDKRADIWAFGVVLYEMLTGRQLFAGATVSDVLAGVLKTEIDLAALPAETPPAVRQLLRRSLERDPRSRLRDIGEARIALDRASLDAAAHLPAPAVAGPARRTTLALGVAAAVFALLFLATLLRPRAAAVPELHLARFPLVTDPSLSVFTELTKPFGVSPDGQTVVFTATKEGSARHLWVRSLGSLEVRELKDTEDATQPAISPDGQWVVFVVGFNEIKKVRLTGGPATHLAKIGGYTAWLTWASNDEILFEVLGAKSGITAGIHRLSAAGGEPKELIPLDSAAGETGERRPFMIRGEGRVVYASEAGHNSALAMFSLGDLRRTQLGIDGVQALGMVDGHLVYAQANGNLMAVPLDVGAMRVTGPAIDLGERVASSSIGTRVMLSDAGTLVSLPSGSDSRLMLVEPSGSSRPLGTETGPFALPRYSPDGRRIVVGSGSSRWATADPGHLDLWLFDSDSGQASRLTRTGLAWAPSWSPDGRRILYTQVASDRTKSEIWALPLDGSAEPSRLLRADASLGLAEMAPDGRSLVAVAFFSDGRQSVVRARLGANPTVTDLFPAGSRDSLRWPTGPRISPDGRLLAFADGEVYVRPLDGAGLLQVSDRGGASPAWGPDSRHLYFGQGNVLSVAELRTSPTLSVVDRHVVAQLPYTSEDFDVAPDGKSFVVVAPESGRSDVIVSLHWTDEVRRRLRAASHSAGGR